MNQLLFLDQHVFLFINHLPHTAFFDLVAKLLSGVGTAGIIWFLLGGLLFLREEKKDHWFLAPFFTAGAASFALVELVLKPLVGRLRPTLDIGAIVIGKANTDFSFPSGHATIAFAMAVVLSKKEPKWRWFFYLLAGAISLSRIYLGKHYPLDVLGGVVFGWCIGSIANRFEPKRKRLV